MNKLFPRNFAATERTFSEKWVSATFLWEMPSCTPEGFSNFHRQLATDGVLICLLLRSQMKL